MARHHVLAAFCIALLASLCAGACVGGPAEPHTELSSALQECGILSEGKVGWWEGWTLDACEAECVSAVMCSGLEEYFCQGWFDPFDDCLAACYGVGDLGFTCSDGRVIHVWEQCDGYPDCEDGEDEQGCPTFACDDGSQVSDNAECDGWTDCADGSDELNCPTYECGDGTHIGRIRWCDSVVDCEDHTDEATCFHCDGGALVSGCDGVPECADGSDEMHCFTCADGNLVPSHWECDFEVQCSDGSDEHDGCAEFLCENGW